MAKEPWTFKLQCGCTVKAVEKGVCVHAVMDGYKGTSVKCPTHGWQYEVVDHSFDPKKELLY